MTSITVGGILGGEGIFGFVGGGLRKGKGRGFKVWMECGDEYTEYIEYTKYT